MPMTSIGASRPASRDSQGQGEARVIMAQLVHVSNQIGNDSAAPQAPTPAVLKFSCVRASRLVLSAAQVNANIVNFPESDVSERDMDRYMDGRTTYRVAVPA